MVIRVLSFIWVIRVIRALRVIRIMVIRLWAFSMGY